MSTYKLLSKFTFPKAIAMTAGSFRGKRKTDIKKRL